MSIPIDCISSLTSLYRSLFLLSFDRRGFFASTVRLNIFCLTSFMNFVNFFLLIFPSFLNESRRRGKGGGKE